MGDRFFDAYVECALWSSHDEDGRPLDESDADIAPASLAEMHADCDAFQRDNADDLEAYCAGLGFGLGAEHAGHDFWLTRCGHGAGFWDRYSGPDEALQAVCTRLTDAAKAYGETYLWVGDDGLIYAT